MIGVLQKNSLKKGIILLLVLAFIMMLMPVFAASDPVPKHEKAISPDGKVSDEYTITLNVTGTDREDSSSSTTVTSSHADVLLVLDATYSMSATMDDGTTRFAAMQKAASRFVSNLKSDSDSHISLVTFQCYDSNERKTPVTTQQDWTSVSGSSKTAVQNTIQNLKLTEQTYGYDTYYGPPLTTADSLLENSTVKENGNNKYVVFFSDGQSADTYDTVLKSVKEKATVFSIGVEPKYWYESTDRIKAVATDESKYYEVHDTDSFVEAFASALEVIREDTTVTTVPMEDVTISDTLSKYVELAGNISVKDGSGKNVVYTDHSSGKTVSVTIKTVPDGETVTLSIPVKPSEAAQKEANTADSEISRFPANDNATLAYSYGSDKKTVSYGQKPEILVKRSLNHSLTYDANGGSGAPAMQVENSAYSCADFTVSSTVPSWKDHDFLGWADSKTAIKPQYKLGDTVTVSGKKTIYAVWKQKTATILWKNEDGTILEKDENVPFGTIPKYDGTTPVKQTDEVYEYTFTGWTPSVKEVTGDTEYTAIYEKKAVEKPTPSESPKPSESARPTATPKPSSTVTPAKEKVILHYESNGGTVFEDETYEKGASVSLTKRPTKNGHVFGGWYLDKDLKKPVETMKMDADRIVYAKWEIDSKVPEELESEEHLAYVSGYPDGTVRPTRNLTRGEAATIFYRLLKNDAKLTYTTEESSFKDIPKGKYYTVPVATLSKMGILSGRNEDIFDPNATITRAEFATICVAFDKSNPDSGKTFKDVTGGWAKPYVEKAAALGWITGYEDGTFRPRNNITRAEAMMLINRMLHRLPQSPDDLHHDMITWPDNIDTSVWYYLPVQEATNSHEYRYKENHLYEKWTSILRTS